MVRLFKGLRIEKKLAGLAGGRGREVQGSVNFFKKLEHEASKKENVLHTSRALVLKSWGACTNHCSGFSILYLRPEQEHMGM